MTDDGKALRALLSPSDRRSVLSDARKAREGLWAALDALDNLLEDSPADSLTLGERATLRDVRDHVLGGFHRLRSGAEDLAGLIPAEQPRPTRSKK